MRETMQRQPEVAPAAGRHNRHPTAAERLRDRRILLIGTGTNWHADNAGAWFMRAAGVEAWAVQGADERCMRLARGLATV